LIKPLKFQENILFFKKNIWNMIEKQNGG